MQITNVRAILGTEEWLRFGPAPESLGLLAIACKRGFLLH